MILEELSTVRIDLHILGLDLKDLDKKIDEKTKLIPDIWTYLDGFFASKVCDYDQELPIINKQLDDHEMRLVVLETK